MTPRLITNFTLLDSGLVLANLPDVIARASTLRDSYLVIEAWDGRYITLPVGVLADVLARMVQQSLQRALTTPVAEILIALAHKPLTTVRSTTSAPTSRAVVRNGQVVGVLRGARPETADAVMAVILHGDTYSQIAGARPPLPVTDSAKSEPTTPDEASKAPPETPVREDIRLDAATPEQVTVAQPFDLAVAIRQPSSPPLKLDDLPNLVSAAGSVYRIGANTLKYRVEVETHDCDVVPPNYLFYLERGADSIVQYFQVIPKREGALTVIVNAYQADDSALAASTRIHLQASVLVSDQSTPTDHDATLKAYAVLQQFFTLDELRDLTYRVGANWDELSGDVLSVKAQSLLTYCSNRNLTPTLYAAINAVRPEADLKTP